MEPVQNLKIFAYFIETNDLFHWYWWIGKLLAYKCFSVTLKCMSNWTKSQDSVNNYQWIHTFRSYYVKMGENKNIFFVNKKRRLIVIRCKDTLTQFDTNLKIAVMLSSTNCKVVSWMSRISPKSSSVLAVRELLKSVEDISLAADVMLVTRFLDNTCD